MILSLFFFITVSSSGLYFLSLGLLEEPKLVGFHIWSPSPTIRHKYSNQDKLSELRLWLCCCLTWSSPIYGQTPPGLQGPLQMALIILSRLTYHFHSPHVKYKLCSAPHKSPKRSKLCHKHALAYAVLSAHNSSLPVSSSLNHTWFSGSCPNPKCYLFREVFLLVLLWSTWHYLGSATALKCGLPPSCWLFSSPLLY